MNRLSPAALFVALATVGGCAGSSSSQSPTRTPADYAGAYSATFYEVPSSGTTPGTDLTAGTSSLTIAPDGSVTGTRREAGSTVDVALTGTITADGTLQLNRATDPVDSGPTLVGSLSKMAGNQAVALLTEFDSSVNGDAWHFYRLTGGTAGTVHQPAITGHALPDLAPQFSGAWIDVQTAEQGNLDLRVARSGKLSGAWIDPHLGTGTLSGKLTANRDAASRTLGSGLLTVSFPGGTQRHLDVRCVLPIADGFVGPFFVVGSAVDLTDGSAYAVRLAPSST